MHCKNIRLNLQENPGTVFSRNSQSRKTGENVFVIMRWYNSTYSMGFEHFTGAASQFAYNPS